MLPVETNIKDAFKQGSVGASCNIIFVFIPHIFIVNICITTTYFIKS